jgi:hypothetical protein
MATFYGVNNSDPTVRNISGIVADSSLRLYFDAGRTASYPGTGYTWSDLSGNGSTITFYKEGGATYSSYQAGPPVFDTSRMGEFIFDGVNDWAKLSADFTGGSTQTFSAWVKFTGAGTMGLLSHYSGGPVNVCYQVSGGKMSYYYYTSSWQTATGITSVNTGTWKHLTWTKNGTAMVMYINGASDLSTTLTGDIGGNFGCVGTNWGPGNSVSYGAGTDTYGMVFGGSIGMVMYYNKALTAAEVLQNYNATKSRFGL